MSSTSKNVHVVTSANFEAEVLRAPLPVLVDFTATWCGPCKALNRVVDQLADETVGKIRVVTVDIDDAPDIAARYGVRAVPTVIGFVRGEKTGHRLGVASKDKLLELVPGARGATAGHPEP